VGADRKTCSRQVNLRVYECVCVCSSTLREREKRKREGTRRDGGFTKPHAHGHFCCSRISGLDDARSWLGERRARPWAAARAGKGPRPVPSCLNSAQRQPSGPACEHHPNTYNWPSRCSVRRTRTAQDAHGAAPRKSGSPAGTRRLRGLCLGAGRRRSRATAPWCSAYTPLEQSVPRASL